VLNVFECISGAHDLWLVGVAGLICLCAALTATALFDQSRITGRRQNNWIMLTGFVSGTGIWATHFVAMLAYKAHLLIGYDLGLTLLSILIAIVVTGVGWWVALGRHRFSAWAGGAIIGLGITVMHFVGMAALIVPGVIVWDEWGIAASLVLGIALGALALAAHAWDSPRLPWRCGLLLTFAICGMHFTGMSAATIVADAATAPPATVGSASLTAAVIASALTILVIGFGVVLLDRRLARGAIEEAAHQRALADAAVEGLLVIDGNRVIDANRSFLKLTGYVGDEIPPCDLASLFPDLDPARLVMGPDVLPVEADLIGARDADRRVEILMRPIFWKGRELRMLAVRDVTERNAANAQIDHLAYHDILTDLPNRVAYGSQLASALATATANDEMVAAFSIGLDNFKAMNDLNGYPAGDELLIAVGRRLRRLIRENDLVARLGGDEFSVLQSRVGKAEDAGLLGDRLLRAMERPVRVGSKSVRIGCSIGVAIFPQDARDPAELMKNADLALSRAKLDGRGVVRFYEAAMDEAIRERRQLGADLQEAIARGELGIHYQPIIDLKTGQVVGFEALARWTHSSRGPISPDLFIPVAEETGFIVKLGDWVLRQATVEATSWDISMAVSVNVSPVQFLQADFVACIKRILDEAALDPSRLDLEVTEGLLIGNADRALAMLLEIKALGATISLDDFGTGYSSLNYLRIFPFDRVKIDQCFVRDMSECYQSRAIIKAMIDLGHGLGLTVIAEGVETEAQLKALRAKGCDLAQGYLISKPQSIQHFDRTILAVPIDSLCLAA
jgi:diguanylate cyclase (GGDEF)-like protein